MTAHSPMARRVAAPACCGCPPERVWATETGICRFCHERVAPSVGRTAANVAHALLCGLVVAGLGLAVMWAFGGAAVVAPK